MPDGRKFNVTYDYKMSEGDIDITHEVMGYYNLVTSNVGNDKVINALAALLRKVRDAKGTNLFVNTDIFTDDKRIIKDWVGGIINKHSLFITNSKSSEKVIAMIKNSVSSKIFRIINDPVNMVSAYSPIEMNEPQEAAQKSSAGNAAKTFVPVNPYVKYNLQYQNMSGKEVIGIAAVGEKVFFALSYYFNEAVRSGDSE